MGCSSSAPSYVDSSTQHANATEDFESAVEDKIEEQIKQKININKLNKGIDSDNGDIVLPESDIVAEPLDVVRNDIQQNSIVEEFVTNTDFSTDSEPKINEQTVIEVLLTEKKEAEERKQRELDFLEELAKLQTEEILPEIKEDAHESLPSDNMESINLSEAIDMQEKDIEASDGDDAQSESSRTTRWEALADVVSELPPSLTIDPVTGHIYTLK